MYISITSILSALVGKCLLNWVLVFFQMQHSSKSFLGVFSALLAAIDTTLTLTVTTIHICSDGFVIVFGYLLTSYHICLLVQIMGEVHSVLQWPVAIIAALDHSCTVTLRLNSAILWVKSFFYISLTVSLWCLAALYIFLLSDFVPILEDVTYQHMNRCWVYPSSQSLHITLLLLFLLGCIVLYAGCSSVFSHRIQPPSQKNPMKTPDQCQTQSCRSFVSQSLCVFLRTWSPFLVFLAVPLLLPVGIPSYLDLNVAWLCFLNSLLIALVLCAICPVSQLSQGLLEVPPDSFCQWKMK